MRPTKRPVLGVSSCLLGERVRYDGRDKREPYLADTLQAYFELRPVCPEVGIGLGVPRPPIHLVGDPERPRVVGVGDERLDVTGALEDFGRRTAAELSGVSGYLFKRGSPSCGLRAVPVAADDRGPGGQGTGAYARQIRSAHPALPTAEERLLRDPRRREAFLECVYLYWRWQCLSETRATPTALRAYHARLRLNLLTRGTSYYRQLGRMLRDVDAGEGRLAGRYLSAAMRVLARPTSRKAQAQVLATALREARDVVPVTGRRALRRLIAAYRRGEIPLSVPLDALRHAVSAGGHPILEQFFLSPHPDELRLRGTAASRPG